jgi:hypothetical protein|tara:strand:- start:309 stop:746 length:438 start_codon:yes stop_codon:yes gene_type:complete
MITIISSLLGFGSSFLPSVLDFFKEKRDQKHELMLMDKQLEQQIKIGAQKIEMMDAEADVREIETLHKTNAQITKKASQFFINLSASVRPVISYAIFIEFIILTFMMANGVISDETYQIIWSEPMQATWSATICFWFGSRSFNRK